MKPGVDAPVDIVPRFRPVLNGAGSRARHTVLSFVMARKDEGWLCVSAQNTDIVPGRETFEATADGLVARDYRKG